MTNDLLYQIALTLVPNIGDVHAKSLVNAYGDAQSVFKAKKKDLEHMEGIGTVRAASIKAFTDFDNSEKEIAESLSLVPATVSRNLPEISDILDLSNVNFGLEFI